jgi:carotenoid cleavage dioxygenase
MRNGANMRFESTGKVHMFDGDAMLHCFRFKNGRVV